MNEEEIIQLSEAYQRLIKNRDFQLIIVDELLHKKAIECAGSYSGEDDDIKTLTTISGLQMYLNSLETLRLIPKEEK